MRPKKHLLMSDKSYLLKGSYQSRPDVNHLFTNVSSLYFYYLRHILHLIRCRNTQSFHDTSQELAGLFLLCIPNLK